MSPIHHPTWAQLPADILSAIGEQVSPGLLRLVCKEWREAVDRATSNLTPEVCHTQLIVTRFPNLAYLDLSEAAATVSNEALQELAHLHRLVSLNLQGCAKVIPHQGKQSARDAPERHLLLYTTAFRHQLLSCLQISPCPTLQHWFVHM